MPPAFPSLAEVVDTLEQRYPLSTAQEWDAVGLVCGDPAAIVERILWAVDPVEVVAEQAIAERADLIVAHHPLFLTGVHSVAATTSKGRIVHRLIDAGIGLYCAHTNADVASPGVSDALAVALGLVDVRPLEPGGPDRGGLAGLGRIADLPAPATLREFAGMVAARLPRTEHGVRVAGDLESPVRRVAVCGGSGDGLLPIATEMGADVLVTADLKHHRALEHAEDGGCSIVDVAHWASEWPWLAQAAALLQEDLAARGSTVESIVSEVPTDPWALTLRSGS